MTRTQPPHSVVLLDSVSPWTHREGFFHLWAVGVRRVSGGWTAFNDIAGLGDPFFQRDHDTDAIYWNIETEVLV